MPENFLPKFKTIDFGSIGAGSTITHEWDFTENYTLKRIYFVEKNDNSLSNVEATIWISNEALTHDTVPARIFGKDLESAIEVNYKVPKAYKLKCSLKNNYTSSRDIFMVLELWPMT